MTSKLIYSAGQECSVEQCLRCNNSSDNQEAPGAESTIVASFAVESSYAVSAAVASNSYLVEAWAVSFPNHL